MEKKKIIAVQLCESIDLKSFIQNFSGKLPTIDSREFFFQNESQQVVYIFNYGVVCFFGYPETERTGLVNQVRKFCTHLLEENIHEEYEIHIRPGSFEIEFDHITIGEPDPVSIKLIMLNISQSVALNYYSKQTAKLLENIQNYTLQLEKYGNFRIGWMKLKMFIGKALTIKNRIANNLYIFDTPPIAWDNEYLNKIDRGMKKEFDLQGRTRNIHDDIKIITENLDLFTNFVFHRRSTYLEWIVILLIFIEVMNILIGRLF